MIYTIVVMKKENWKAHTIIQEEQIENKNIKIRFINL